MAGWKRLGELYPTMPFGEAMDGGRGGNRYRRGRLGKTDNFYQISRPVHPGLDHVVRRRTSCGQNRPIFSLSLSVSVAPPPKELL